MDQKKRLGFCTWALSLIGIVGVGTLPPVHGEVDPKYYAVMASAEVQSTPARITLRWEGDSQATGYSISRREGDSWQDVGRVGGDVTRWTDENVRDGGTYEYRIIKSTSAGYTGSGFLYAGINAPLKEA